MKYIDASKMRTLYVGYQGEDNRTTVMFPTSCLTDEPENGTFTLFVKRNGDTLAYPVPTTLENGKVCWIVREVDTAKIGHGEAQLIFMDSNGISKTKVWDICVYASITSDGSEDDPADDYVSKVLRAANDIKDLTVSAHSLTADSAPTATKTKPEGQPFNIDFGIPSSSNANPFTSLERLRSYLYRVSFTTIPEENETDFFAPAGCTSYVENGKLYRNLDWNYSETPEFIVQCKGFKGMAFSDAMTDASLNPALIGQLPYHIVDGRNDYGIMVSTHVLYNDWNAYGDGDIPLTKLPYLVLTKVKSMATLEDDLDGILDNLVVPASMQAAEYLIQVLVTDGTTSYVLRPSLNSSFYEAVNITSNPKLTNFRWVSDATVERTQLQERPTGVERWNMIPANLEELRFTKAYESPNRLSEFIGIDGTDKDSTDEELEAIYDKAHTKYLTRTRNGELWQTMHSVVYSAKGMEELYVQEDYQVNYGTGNACKKTTFVTPEMYGAKGDGVNDDTIALQAAISAGEALEYPVICNATYKITDTIYINNNVKINGMVVYNGDGTGIVIGKDSENLMNANIKLRIRRESQDVPDVTKNNIGVKFINVNTCNIVIDYVSDFYYGAIIYAKGRGNAYNKYYITEILNAKECLVIDNSDGGWCNENLFFGGRFCAYSDSSFQPFTGIVITSSHNYYSNNNVFYHPCIENAETAIKIEYGTQNYFYDVRTENVSTVLSVFNSSTFNTVGIGYGNKTVQFYGSGINKVYELFDLGHNSPAIYDTGGLTNICVENASGVSCGKLYRHNVSTGKNEIILPGCYANSEGFGGANCGGGIILDNIKSDEVYIINVYGKNLSYRPYVVQYDASGNLISGEIGQVGTRDISPVLRYSSYMQYGTFATLAGGNVWIAQADLTESAVPIQFSHDCVKAFVGIRISGTSTIINRFAIKGNSGNVTNVFPVVQLPSIPMSNGWYNGMTVLSSAPTTSARGWWWDGTVWQTFV